MKITPYAGNGRGYSACAVPTCDKAHYAKRLCSEHYQAYYRERKRDGYVHRHIKLDELQAVIDERSVNCNLEDCDNKRHARGLCLKHYVQYLRLSKNAKA